MYSLVYLDVVISPAGIFHKTSEKDQTLPPFSLKSPGLLGFNVNSSASFITSSVCFFVVACIFSTYRCTFSVPPFVRFFVCDSSIAPPNRFLIPAFLCFPSHLLERDVSCFDSSLHSAQSDCCFLRPPD